MRALAEVLAATSQELHNNSTEILANSASTKMLAEGASTEMLADRFSTEISADTGMIIEQVDENIEGDAKEGASRVGGRGTFSVGCYPKVRVKDKDRVWVNDRDRVRVKNRNRIREKDRKLSK
jgi:hypothetical protein